MKKIKWMKKTGDIYMGIGPVSFASIGGKKVAMDIAFRADHRGDAWRVDFTSSSSTPWEAIDGGLGVSSLSAAKLLSQGWLDAVNKQKTLSPNIVLTANPMSPRKGCGNPPICYIPAIPPPPPMAPPKRSRVKKGKANPPESRVMSIQRPRAQPWDYERMAMLPPPPPRMRPDLPIPPLKLAQLSSDLDLVCEMKTGVSRAGAAITRKSAKPATKVRAPSKAPLASARDLAPVSKAFVLYRKIAAQRFPDIGLTRLEASTEIHDTPRAYAITEITKKGPVITVAPELARQPQIVIDGVIAHELGHVAVMLGHYPMKAGHDSMQRQADSVAEEMFGDKIYYTKNGKVQCMGKGAKGTRPRPANLR